VLLNRRKRLEWWYLVEMEELTTYVIVRGGREERD
jgi:hypothetical protein